MTLLMPVSSHKEILFNKPNKHSLKLNLSNAKGVGNQETTTQVSPTGISQNQFLRNENLINGYLPQKYLSQDKNLPQKCQIGAGTYGLVYENEDPQHLESVIKKVRKKVGKEEISLDMVKKEVALFRAYYGSTSADFIREDDQCFYIRMDKVPGKPLASLIQSDEKWKPRDMNAFGLELFNLIKRLDEVGIFHADLHPGNLLYNEESTTLYPVDFGHAVFTNDTSDDVISKETRDKIKNTLFVYDYNMAGNRHWIDDLGIFSH